MAPGHKRLLRAMAAALAGNGAVEAAFSDSFPCDPAIARVVTASVIAREDPERDAPLRIPPR